MAAKIEFKQQCPSCEAQVPIRDRKLVGRKIDCPKCKYRFVVEDPDAEADEAPGKKGKGGNGASARRPGARGKGRPGEAEGKPEAGGNRTLVMGLILGAAALVLLGIVGYLLFGPDGTPKPPSGPGPGPQAGDSSPDDQPQQKDTPAVAIDPTNLLPNDTQTVLSVHVPKALGNALGRLFFDTPGGFSRDGFRNTFGLNVEEVKRLVRASNDDDGWEFSVMTTSRPVRVDELKKLGLKPGPKSPINGLEYYVIDGQLDPLSKYFFNKGNKPLALFPADPYTLVLAHLPPMEKFLDAKAKPKPLAQPPGANPNPGEGGQPADNPPAGGAPAVGQIGRQVIATDVGQPPADRPMEGNDPSQGRPAALSGSYLTINPTLKSMLDRLEEGKEPVFSLASLPGRTPPTVVAGPESNLPAGAQKLMVARPTVKVAEAIQPDRTVVSVGWEFKTGEEALNAEKVVRTLITPEVLKAMEKQVGTEVVLLDEQGNVPPPPEPPVPPGGGFDEWPVQPVTPPRPPDVKLSKIHPRVRDKMLQVRYDLLPTPEALDAVVTPLQSMIVQIKSKAEMTVVKPRLHELAAALGAYVEKNGQFPRGTLEREPGVERAGLPWRPDQCLSWMVELLPYLGQGDFRNVYDNLNFKKGWRDPENAVAAAVLVPHFLTPNAPEELWWVKYPGVENLPFAATHIVGISGVGLDSADADFAAIDPAWEKKVGIFGYERVTKPDDVKDGLANTIALLLVPPRYKTPWMAGGGSTVRGVPEEPRPGERIVTPFVCTEHEGKRGTFAIMADGAVRFIPEDIPDDVFKALCTIAGGESVENLDGVAPPVQGLNPMLKPMAPPVKPEPPPAVLEKEDKKPAEK